MEAKHTLALAAVQHRVHDANTGDLIATLWPRKTSEECKKGESWSDMQHRTAPERAAADAEMFANARLFAAAPDLLDALQNLYALVKGECPSLLADDHHDEMVRTAIAKATGAAT